MWLRPCHKPPMAGNGNHTTYKNDDDWGMVYSCFTHITWIVDDSGQFFKIALTDFGCQCLIML